jgi:ABC-type nickel/cobalt efflux system permease component RcnA
MRPPRAWSLAALALTLAAAPAHGHPLGNFSINHYAGLRVGPGRIELTYVIDMAEIPTFQEMQAHALVADAGHPSAVQYLHRATEGLGEGLHLEVNGSRRALRAASREVTFVPGAGDLPTLRLRAVYRTDLDAALLRPLNELRYRDANFPGRAGWKEIVAVADTGASVTSSSVPEEDRSRALSDYPADLLNSPPQDLDARVVFALAPASLLAEGAASVPSRPSRVLAGRTAGAGEPLASPAMSSGIPPAPTGGIPPAPSGHASLVSSGEARPEPPPSMPALRAPAAPSIAVARAVTAATPRSAFTQLVTAPDLSIGIFVLAMATALGVGAMHALEPGHGKTIVAAYLVGARGTARHAVFLGLVVTATHTLGVFALGLVVLYASRHVVPERLYPWVGAASGLTIAALGFWLLVQRLARGLAGDPEPSHDHGHEHPHGAHHHDGHEHPHGAGHHHGDEHPHGARHHHADGRAHGADHPHAGVHTHAADDHHHHDHHHAHGSRRGQHRHDVPASLRELLALGVTGGIVPCPAALVVLLSAIALRRTGFGLLLIVAFSVGLASVLVAIGLLMVHARRFMARVQGDGPIVRRWLPLASAAVIAVLGIAIAVQALVAAGIVQIRL